MKKSKPIDALASLIDSTKSVVKPVAIPSNPATEMKKKLTRFSSIKAKLKSNK